ncbi:hypothetical protein PMIN01_08110 [Paraphaeosphaeria minitans]|uniref:CCHC-type domain-containing protein n=1 Tax=Paraphaeosphaeria minitans TaxID=565426 RepID=A0A9P6GDU6_9PLEO|nr:hypothetical protein PMIN01_08110 [Paraphaeosphaeria minitans]
MATQWPQQATWPSPIHEHATRLSTYLQDSLSCIKRTNSQPVPADLVKTIIHGTVTFILKVQHTPDLSAISDALRILQTEAKTAATENAHTLSDIKNELKSSTEAVRQCTTATQQNTNTGEEARAAAKEASETSKAVLEITREIKTKGIQNQANGPMTYAAMAARGQTLAGAYNTQSPKGPSAQAQREVIVNIRDSSTVQSLRVMNPRNLKAHVERAIEQSGNENIVHIKIVSSNQLKSGDLSIKTANSKEVEALQQFADDWVHRISAQATVRIPTYGVIVHGIRTSTLDMDKFEENRTQILQDNKPFIPRAEIKHIGWLTRNAPTKAASSITIEFTKAEDANKIIDEGLVWQGEVFQCERYERQCRLKQCYKCQKYGHIGTQCKAATACGYCAQEHDTRDCPSKSGLDTTKKCALCRGEHEAWNRQCPARKAETAKMKIAYDTRPRYHPVPEPTGGTAQRGGMPEARQRTRTNGATASQDVQSGRTRSLSRRGQKRTNTGNIVSSRDGENQQTGEENSHRPQRTIVPSRRALEAIESNTRLIQWHDQQMDVDENTES